MNRPFLFFAVGAVLASIFAVNFVEYSLELFLFCIILVVINVLFYIFTKSFIKSLCIFAAMALVFLSASVIYYSSILPVSKLESKTVKITAVVLESPSFYDDHISYSVKVLDVESNSCPKFNADIVDYSGITVADVSDVISADVRFSNTSQNNNKAYYYSNKVFINGSFVSNLEVVGHNTNFLMSARKYINNFYESVLPTEISSVLSALTIGDKSALSDDFSDNIRSSGVSHMMVVSGMHLAIICRFLMRTLKKLHLNSRLSALISIIAIVFVVALCSFTVSALRAGFTYVVMLLGVIFYKRADAVNSLCFAATAIFIFNPFAVANVSFQLSFASTLGIILICPTAVSRIKEVLPKNKIYNPLCDICELLVVNFAATVATLPIGVYQFGELSVISPVTNILTSYCVTVVLVLALISVLVSLLPYSEFIYMPLLFACGLITKYINCVINRLGSQPFASVSVNKNSAFIILIIYAAVIAALHYFKRSREYAYSR